MGVGTYINDMKHDNFLVMVLIFDIVFLQFCVFSAYALLSSTNEVFTIIAIYLFTIGLELCVLFNCKLSKRSDNLFSRIFVRVRMSFVLLFSLFMLIGGWFLLIVNEENEISNRTGLLLGYNLIPLLLSLGNFYITKTVMAKETKVTIESLLSEDSEIAK